MDAVLKKGAVIRLEGKSGSFEVLGVHGRGGSCVVYRARYKDTVGNQMDYLMKEFNPVSLAMERDEAGKLVCPEKKREAFQVGLERFQQGYRTQEAIQRITELRNSTAPLYGRYFGNGTCYILTPLFEGKTYAEVQDESLVDTLTTVKTLTKAVGEYHRDGYLHLDIKPANMLVLPETRELIILFDFDSVIRKERAREARFLSYTQNWAAPEQIVPSLHQNICEATDLFAIGEVLFTKVMGRHSTDRERRPSCSHQKLRESTMLDGMDERVFRALADLFRNTLCSSVKRRWKSADSLLDALEELLRLVKQEHRICTSCPAPKSVFIGRSTELEQIHQGLERFCVLILSGMGGVGKSELAKNYAARYTGEYDAVVFAFYSVNLMTTIADDCAVPISNFGQIEGESTREYFDRKLRKLKELCAEQKTLLILDNLNQSEFDAEEAEHWKALLELPCKLLVTSRASDWEFEAIPVRNLPEETAMELFLTHYGDCLAAAQAAAARELLAFLGNHTMAVEMAAKQLKASAETPSELLERLKASVLSQMGREKVRGEKDGKAVKAPAFEHIQTLFQVAELGVEEQQVLLNMALVHPDGIKKRTFKEWSGLSSLDVVNGLCSSGWLSEREGGISMHPLVSEVILSSAAEAPTVCSRFLMKYGNYLAKDLSRIDLKNRLFKRRIGHWTGQRMTRYGFFAEGAQTLGAQNFCAGLERLLQSLGDVSDTVYYAKRAMELAERLYDVNSAKLVVPYNNYGAALSFSSNWEEGARYYKKAANILTALDKSCKSQASHGIVLNNIANEYKHNGQFAEAEQYYKKALDTLSERGEDETTAVAYRNLGKFYIDTGKLSAAYEYLQNALRIQLDADREYSTHTIDIYASLAQYYQLTGKHEEARDTLFKAIDISKKLIGEQNTRTAVLYLDLGSLEIDTENYDAALANYQYANEIFQKVLPAGHNDIISGQNALGIVLLKQEKFAEAKQLYLALCKEWREKYLNGDEEHIAVAYVNLSSACRGLEDFPLAEEYARRGLKIFLDIYGEQHQKVASVYSSLGETQRRAGKLDAAVESLQKALKIRQGLFGERHGAVALVRQRLGTVYQERGDYEKAVDEYVAAFGIYRNMPSKGYDAKLVLYNLIAVLSLLGRENEAERYRPYLGQE